MCYCGEVCNSSNSPWTREVLYLDKKLDPFLLLDKTIKRLLWVLMVLLNSSATYHSQLICVLVYGMQKSYIGVLLGSMLNGFGDLFSFFSDLIRDNLNRDSATIAI